MGDMERMDGKVLLLLVTSAFTLGALTGLMSPKYSWVLSWVIGLLFPLLVVMRIVVDTSRDSTSHNLFPLEILVACGISLLPALIGSHLGSRWREKQKQ